MRRPDLFAGAHALVTGAGGGMGRALCAGLAARGATVTALDRDGAAAEGTVAALSGGGHRAQALDVADRAAVGALAGRLDRVDLLFNNAGVGATGRFADLPAEAFDRVLAVNLHAVVDVTRAVLPLMGRGREGRIVNTASLWGLLAPAGHTAYCASKFAVAGFSQALAHELAGTPVGVTTVYPGGVATGIAQAGLVPPGETEAARAARLAQAARLLKMPPEAAARRILRAVARRRARVLVGADAWQGALLARLLPGSYWAVLRRFGVDAV